ncbi:hypothetical protein T05_13532, partial [Trichinella murrelli]
MLIFGVCLQVKIRKLSVKYHSILATRSAMRLIKKLALTASSMLCIFQFCSAQTSKCQVAAGNRDAD